MAVGHATRTLKKCHRFIAFNTYTIKSILFPVPCSLFPVSSILPLPKKKFQNP
ncbi:MAG: hypothetical protein F6K56_06930 [Moorea sp. SIO3G5]|nr:hypothetical protein [Moorena sp. SIO3G5]